MAKMVWKCDFCYCEYFENEQEALTHEKICGYNISTNKCETCEYYEETGYPISGSDMRCMNKDCNLFDKNISYFLENKNEKDYFPCKYWKKEN